MNMTSGSCKSLPKIPYKFKYLWVCCASVLACSGVAFAQDESDEQQADAYRINPITVYGQPEADDSETTVAKELWVGGKVATSVLDTPAMVSVITEKEINQRGASTTEEVLQYSPGLVTDYYGSDDRNDYFSIRGFDATTYRDGLTLGSMRSVREDPYAYERVEVIRGANSTLFGPADPGGSVNFVSKRPKFERFGDTYVSYGSFDSKEVGVDVGDTVNADKTVAVRFTTKLKQGALEYDHSKDDSQLVMGGVTWQPSSDTTASLLVDYLGRDSTPNSGGYPLDKEYDRSNFYGEPDYNKHDVSRTNITAQISHYITSDLKLSSNLRYSDLTDNFGYIYLYDYTGRTGSDISRYYFGTDSSSHELIGNTVLQYDASFDRIDSSSLIGLEYSDTSNHTKSVYGSASVINIDNPVYSGVPTIGSPYSKNDQDYKNKSAFIQQNLSLDDRYILTLGARHDYLDLDNRDINGVKTSGDFSETSLRAALTYKVTHEWSTYVSHVESVAPPSIGVKPERGEQVELGVKYAPESIDALFSAAIYDLNKKDVTIAVVQPSGVIERQTVGETRVRGLDLEMKMEVADNFNLTGGYSYMHSEVVRGTTSSGTSQEGNEFASTPNHSASLWGYYTLPIETMDVGLGARYIGSYYFDLNNTAKSEAATLLDAAFKYRMNKSTNLTVNVDNLTDKQYVVGSGTANYYNPGRTFNAAIHYTW